MKSSLQALDKAIRLSEILTKEMPETIKSAGSDRISQLLLQTLKTERTLIQLAGPSTETDIKVANDALLASFGQVVECLSTQSTHIEKTVLESIFRCAMRFLTRPSTTLKLPHLAVRCLRSCKSQSAEVLSGQNVVIVLGNLASLLEQLKSPTASGLDNMTEEVACEIFGCILDIVQDQKFGLDAESKDVISAFLPQLIHSGLTFTSHSSKTLSLASIQSLSALLYVFDVFTEIWSSSFPGIFSAVFKVIQHGNNRQSRFLLENTIFLLYCFQLVSRPFMLFISESEEGKEMWKEQLLGLASTASSATTLPLWKWRVDLLQHIHTPLPALLRSTMTSLTTVQSREILKHEIIEFIVASAEFVGVELTGEILGIIADVESVDMMIKMKEKGIFYHRLQQTFHDHLTTSFHRLTTSSLLHNTSPSDTQMTQCLAQILGFWGYLGVKDRKAWVVINQDMIMDTLVKLCMPSVEVASGSNRVVEMIRCVDTLYHDIAQSMVDVSYFDATYPIALHNNKQCLYLLNILCIELAHEEYDSMVHEITLRIHELIRRLTDKLLLSISKSSKNKSKGKKKHNKSVANTSVVAEGKKEEDKVSDGLHKQKQKILILAAFIRLQTMFTCHHVSITPRSVSSVANTVDCCVVCSVSNVSLSRCSRCRVVWYCSREHQVAHWSSHRLVCNQTAAAIPNKSSESSKQKDSEKENKEKDSSKQAKDLLSLRTKTNILLMHKTSSGAETRLESIINILSQSLDFYLHLTIDNSSSSSSSRKNAVLTPSLEQLTMITLNSIADLPLLFGAELILKNGLFLQKLLFKVLIFMFSSVSKMVSTVASTTLTRLALTLHPISIPHFIRHNLDYIVDSACRYFKMRLLTSPLCIYATLVGILKMLSEANIADEVAVRLLRDAAMDGLEVLDESYTLGMYANDDDDNRDDEAEGGDDSKHAAVIAAVNMLAALPLVDPLPYASLASLLVKNGMDIVGMWLTDAEKSQLQSEITSQQQLANNHDEDESSEVGRAMLQSLIDFDQSLFALHGIHHAEPSDTPVEASTASPEQLTQDVKNASNAASRQLLVDLLPRLALQLARPARTLTLTTLDGLAAILLRLHAPYVLPQEIAGKESVEDDVHDILPQALHMVWETLLPRLTQLCSLYNKRILAKAMDKVALSHGSSSSGGVSKQKVVTRQRLEIGCADSEKDALVIKLLQQTTATRSNASASSSPSKPLLITASDQPQRQQQMHQQQRALFALPRLWEFISLLSLLRPSFLQHKLLEDLWPLLLRSLQAVSLSLSLSVGPAAKKMNALDQHLAVALLTITRRLVVMELCPNRAVSVIALLLQPMLGLSDDDGDCRVMRVQATELMHELLARDPTASFTSSSESKSMYKAIAAAYDLQQLQPRVRVLTTFSQPRYPSEILDDKLRQQLEVRQHAVMQRDVQASLLCLGGSSNTSNNGQQLMVKGVSEEAVGGSKAMVDGKWMNKQLKRWSTAC